LYNDNDACSRRLVCVENRSGKIVNRKPHAEKEPEKFRESPIATLICTFFPNGDGGSQEDNGHGRQEILPVAATILQSAPLGDDV